MSQFTKALVVSPLADGRTWVLLDSFSYDVGAVGSGDTITVPAKFMTDFASVPQLFWTVLPPWGRYGNAAVIHDFCYWDKTRTRFQADRIFLQAMKVLKVGVLTRYTLFGFVRLFGRWAWWQDRRFKRGGGSMIAYRLPEKVREPATAPS